MLTNCHTHTTFCDGENTPEEVVLYAIEKGFASIGFSGHGYTPFDLRYCVKDIDGYVREISELKMKYKDKIQVYCGMEEESFCCVQRENFDYIIGSSHYFNINGEYYSIDDNYDGFKKCLEVFEYDTARLAEAYYSSFVNYIKMRKPDIVGHFDLITKFDEIDGMRLLNDCKYNKVAEEYMEKAAENDVIFEVNTGAVSRGYRKTPYPAENLLHILKKNDSKIILSSDSHSVETLDSYFDEAERIIRDIGFEYVYEMNEGRFKKRYIK